MAKRKAQLTREELSKKLIKLLTQADADPKEIAQLYLLDVELCETDEKRSFVSEVRKNLNQLLKVMQTDNAQPTQDLLVGTILEEYTSNEVN